ncbi:uncharacterized protein LOC106464137 [Limulus polyphemus]|uniref:Uncharacterized protein LOC106464137 n=1 Tax=Limulus polyphemus TaxID=6850 RepID=A0ABM1BDC1_LIMPO|nr:uncharacterized protein LOC106464137 [Limulus polyphemus]
MSKYRYVCDACDYVAETRGTLLQHVASHHAAQVFRCPACPFITQYRANLRRHKRTIHGIRPNVSHRMLQKMKVRMRKTQKFQDGGYHEKQVNFCQSPGNVKNQTFQALSSNIPGKSQLQLKAPKEDNDTFDKKYSITSKKSTETLPLEGYLRVRRVYRCRQCDLVTINPRKFLYHRQEVHMERITVYECPYCLYASKNFQKLQRHCGMVHKKMLVKNTDSTQIKQNPQNERKAVKSIQNSCQKLLNSRSLTSSSKTIKDNDMGSPLERNKNKASSTKCTDAKTNSTENHKKENLQKCDYECLKHNLKTKSKVEMKRHENTFHLKKKFFRCLKCSYVTSERAKYTRHCKFHSLPKLKCSFCDFQTAYKWNLDRHLKNHGLEGAFRCCECSFKTHDKQSLLMHQCDHKNSNCEQEESSFPDYTQGEYRFVDRSSSAENNNDDSLVHDENCKNSPKLSFTYDKVEAMKSNKLMKKRLKCRFCAFTACPSGVRRHEMGHLTKKKYSCPTCGLGFDLLPYFTRHIKQEHGTTEKVAKIIVQGLKRKSGTVKSIPTCVVCGYKSKWMSELEKHLRVHSGEKPFLCCYCRYQTKWKGDLTRHLKKYHPNKPEMPFFKQKLVPKIKIKMAKSSLPVINSHMSNGSVKYKVSVPVKKDIKTLTKKISHLSDNEELPLDLSAPPKITSFINEYKNMSYSEVNICKDELNNTSQNGEQKLQLEISSVNEHDSTNCSSEKMKTKKYKCNQCHFETLSVSSFHTHYVQHHDRQEFMCSACGYKSEKQWEITKHIKMKFANDPVHHYATCLLSCNMGEVDFTKYLKFLIEAPPDNNLKNHTKSDMEKSSEIFNESAVIYDNNNDTTQNKISPAHLVQSTNSREARNKIFKVGLVGNYSNNINKLYHCNLCNFKHSDRKVVVSHMTVHAGVKPYRCRICKFTSNWRHVILRHIKNKHCGNFKDLEECFSFKLKSRVLHLTSISTESKQVAKKNCYPLEWFKCNLCPYSCQKQFYMKTHLKQHQPRDGSLLKCLHCPYYVKYRKTLVRHMKLHEQYSANITIKHSMNSAAGRGEDWEDASIHSCKKDKKNSSNDIFEDVKSTLKCVGDIDKTEETSTNPLFGCTSLFKKYMCSQCPYKSDNRKQFLHHKQFHRPNRAAPHRCTVCSYWATRLHLLKQHMKLHIIHTKSIDRENEFPSKESIQEDVPFEITEKGNFLVKTYKCCYCPMKNRRRANVKLHMSMHNRDTVSKFSCPICNYQCNNQGVLGVHLKLHQESEVDVFLKTTNGTEILKGCSTPPEPIIDSKNVQNESCVNYNEKRTLIGNEGEKLNLLTEQCSLTPYNRKVNFSYFCMNCPALFKSIGGFRTHKSLHGANHPFRCPFCDYTARHKPHLHKHLLVHSPAYAAKRKASNAPPLNISDKMCNLQDSNKYSSDKNEKSGISIKESTMNNQMLLLEEAETQSYLQGLCQKVSQKLFSCPLCPAKFVKQTTLNFHLGLHGGPGLHICSNCNYTVPTTCSLLTHTALHSQLYKFEHLQQKSYQCPKCPAAFSKHSRYDRHVLLHGKKSKYTCEKCDYSVRCAANLYKHNNVHEKTLLHNPYVVQEASVPQGLIYGKQVSEKNTVSAESRVDAIYKENIKHIFRCDRCPYTSENKNEVQNHQKQHNAQGGITCPHCDYRTTLMSCILDHINSHFQVQDFLTVKAFMEPMVELWSVENENREQIFSADKTSIHYKSFETLQEVEYLGLARDKIHDGTARNFQLSAEPDSGNKYSKEEFLLNLNVVEKKNVSVIRSEHNTKILKPIEKYFHRDVTYVQLAKQNASEKLATEFCSISREVHNLQKTQCQQSEVSQNLFSDAKVPLSTESNGLSLEELKTITSQVSQVCESNKENSLLEYNEENMCMNQDSSECKEFLLHKAGELKVSQLVCDNSAQLIKSSLSESTNMKQGLHTDLQLNVKPATDTHFVIKKRKEKNLLLPESLTMEGKENKLEDPYMNFHDYETKSKFSVKNSVTDVKETNKSQNEPQIVLSHTNSCQFKNDNSTSNDEELKIMKKEEPDKLETWCQESNVKDLKKYESPELSSVSEFVSPFLKNTLTANDPSCINIDTPKEDFIKSHKQKEVKDINEHDTDISVEELMRKSESDSMCTKPCAEQNNESIQHHTETVKDFSHEHKMNEISTEQSDSILSLNNLSLFSIVNENDMDLDGQTENFMLEDSKPVFLHSERKIEVLETQKQITTFETGNTLYNDFRPPNSVNILNHNSDSIQSNDVTELSSVLENSQEKNEGKFFKTSLTSDSQLLDLTSMTEDQTDDFVIGSDMFYIWDVELSDYSDVGANVSIGDSKENSMCSLGVNYDLCTSSNSIVCLSQEEIDSYDFEYHTSVESKQSRSELFAETKNQEQ